MTQQQPKESTVARRLDKGEQNAKKGKELAEALNIPIRELVAIIEDERRKGFPICASQGRNPGYYLAANKWEMEIYCAQLRHREEELHRTRLACASTIETLPAERIGK